MSMKFSFFSILFFLTFSVVSQQKFSKEFSFINDNDLFASKEKDRYYSNGLFFTYRFLSSKPEHLEKKIIEIQIGHELYTPYKSTVLNVNLHDRPFAAYLYGNFGMTRVYENDRIIKNNLQIGVVGKSAFGKELQETIHNIYNFRSPVGWKYQIRNTVALNFDTEYYKALGTDKTNHYDTNFIGKLRLGTIFTEATAGIMGRIGFKKLQPIQNSIAFNTNLNNEVTSYIRGVESFLYYETSLTYVLYDTTIEGSLFNNDSPVTFNPKALRFDLEVGYKFTANRWNFGYAFHFHSNKLPNLRNDKGNYYGQLFFSYLFN